MNGASRGVTHAAIEPLTRHEIERRIEDVITEVSARTDREIGSLSSPEGFRWIALADLVRRMRPYLSPN